MAKAFSDNEKEIIRKRLKGQLWKIHLDERGRSLG
jgi:hypothetical protein